RAGDRAVDDVPRLQSAAGPDAERAAGGAETALEHERAGDHVGWAGVVVCAGEGEDASAGLRQPAAAADRASVARRIVVRADGEHGAAKRDVAASGERADRFAAIV